MTDHERCNSLAAKVADYLRAVPCQAVYIYGDEVHGTLPSGKHVLVILAGRDQPDDATQAQLERWREQGHVAFIAASLYDVTRIMVKHIGGVT